MALKICEFKKPKQIHNSSISLHSGGARSFRWGSGGRPSHPIAERAAETIECVCVESRGLDMDSVGDGNASFPPVFVAGCRLEADICHEVGGGGGSGDSPRIESESKGSVNPRLPPRRLRRYI